MKSQRLKWLGHVERIPNEREVKGIYKWKPLASRPKGRSKNRWEDDMRKEKMPNEREVTRIYKWKPLASGP
jgi:hypothetical protein